MLVIDVMVKDVITVTKDTPVREAQKIMRENKIHRLPVIDSDGKPIGVVTEERLERIMKTLRGSIEVLEDDLGWENAKNNNDKDSRKP